MAFTSPAPYPNLFYPPTSKTVQQGRLSLSATLANPVVDITAAAVLYFLNYLGSLIGLYVGGVWTPVSFGAISVSLAALAANEIDDVFAFFSNGVVNLELVPWRNYGQLITGATNATPIVITSATHGLTSGDEVYISGVGVNTGANGTWKINKLSANTYELNGSAGNGTYAAATGWMSARKLLTGKALGGATNAAPIVIAATAHGLATGANVTIVHAKGNTGANGTFNITVVDADHFSLDGSTGNGALTAGTGYYVDNSLPALSGLQDGVPVKPGDPTRRLLGVVGADGTGGQSESSVLNRLVSNLYNAISQLLSVGDATSHTYAAATYQAWNAAASNAFKFLLVEPRVVSVNLNARSSSGQAADLSETGVGLDRATGTDIDPVINSDTVSIAAGTSQQLVTGVGPHSLTAVEAASAGTSTFPSYRLSAQVAN